MDKLPTFHDLANKAAEAAVIGMLSRALDRIRRGDSLADAADDIKHTARVIKSAMDAGTRVTNVATELHKDKIDKLNKNIERLRKKNNELNQRNERLKNSIHLAASKADLVRYNNPNDSEVSALCLRILDAAKIADHGTEIPMNKLPYDNDVPKHRKKYGGKKPWVVECYWDIPIMQYNGWSLWKRYKTEKDRDKGLDMLNKKDNHLRYRAVDPGNHP